MPPLMAQWLMWTMTWQTNIHTHHHSLLFAQLFRGITCFDDSGGGGGGQLWVDFLQLKEDWLSLASLFSFSNLFRLCGHCLSLLMLLLLFQQFGRCVVVCRLSHKRGVYCLANLQTLIGLNCLVCEHQQIKTQTQTHTHRHWQTHKLC